VWHESEGDVSVEAVLTHLEANSATSAAILRALANAGLPERTCDCADALRHAVITAPDRIGPEERARLGIIADRYLPASTS
jgi:5'-methylthioadenosine phosphorylase